MLIADQVVLNTAALSCYTQIAADMPDAETGGDYGWYFSTEGIEDMEETETINGKLWHFKTFNGDLTGLSTEVAANYPTGYYSIRVYSTADLEESFLKADKAKKAAK